MLAMSLKSTVRGAIAGIALAGVLIVSGTAGAYLLLRKSQSDVEFANTVSANVAKLNLLTSELVVRGSERVFHQWRRQHQLLIAHLANPPRFDNHADGLAGEIRNRAAKISLAFDQIQAFAARARLGAPASTSAREMVFTAMIAQAGAIHSRSLEMSEIAGAAASGTRRLIFLTLGGGFLVATIVSGLVMSLLSHGLLTRILTLRSVIQEIGAGKLDAEIPAANGDEMGDVFRELDQMRLGLLRSIGELGRVNLELIAAKADLEDRVAERTAGLEGVNRELEAFTYAVSHDLRAPLRTISGFSEAVLEDYGDRLDEEGRSMLRRVHRATGQMTQLIEDLLKISRLNAAPLDIAEIDLSQIVETVGETLRERTPERTVTLTVQPGIRAQADGRLMTIILTNLVENAWKFTAGTPVAHITFSQFLEGNRTTYVLSDNGAGFDMAYSDKLFQPFQRLHSSEQFPGTGIGLATVGRIIRMHHGQIWAQSEPGRGAKFFFQLGAAAKAMTHGSQTGRRPSTDAHVRPALRLAGGG